MKPPYDPSYIFLLRSGLDELEVQYNQQYEKVYLAEAQISIKSQQIEGYTYFEIDNTEDMDRLISYLSELREKMNAHYEKLNDEKND